MSEHGAIAITYGATEAQRHRERTEWQRLTGDDSTRGRKAANTDREDGHANPIVSRARFACPPSRSVPGPAPQARPRRILCVSVPLWPFSTTVAVVRLANGCRFGSAR